MFKTCSLYLVVFLLSVAASYGQADQTQKIKDKIAKIGVKEDVTVRQIDDRAYHGFIQSIDADSFSVADVDLKSTVIIRYSDVKSITKGYGPKSPLTGHRRNPKKSGIIALIAVGAALAIPIIIVASVKD